MKMKILPKQCPSCNSLLKVQRLHCDNCGTNIEGLYELPLLSRLDDESQRFVLSFVKHSGSLKKMAKELGLSYPTVRNMLNDIISQVEQLEQNTQDNE
jgi:hypothetical protein